MKKLLWITTTAIASGLAAAYAARAVDALWRRATHEEPPGMPKWGTLMALPIRRSVNARFSPATA